MSGRESRLGRAYRTLHESLCGRHPLLRPWHFQWLTAHFLNRDLRRWLPSMRGQVLDVGCGRRPYEAWMTGADWVVGIDVSRVAGVDVVVSPEHGWPFPDRSFDAVLMTQVMEYVEDAGGVMVEIRRVLKPNGRAIVSFPFLYNAHGANDRTRLSANLGTRTFAGFHAVTVSRQGGFGSTLAILSLNWLDRSLNQNYATRLTRPFILPLWLPLCLLVNFSALLVNRLDRTNDFYSNVFLVLERVDDPPPIRLSES